MKYSLLDLTQNILSSLNSDEVNSISDSTESRQVSEIVRSTYFSIINRLNLPEHMQLFQLDSSGNADLPVVMYRPEHVARIDWIKYDTNLVSEVDEPQYNYVTILPVQQFLEIIDKFNPEEAHVHSFELDDFRFYYKDNKKPEFCMIHKDSQIIADSFDAAIDSTLQSNKTRCYGRVIPTFEMSNTFVPNLDETQFPLLLNEAKSAAFIELKQAPNEKSEQEARRQWRSSQKTKFLETPSDFDKLPNFGRK